MTAPPYVTPVPRKSTAAESRDPEADLQDLMGELATDPYGFVLAAYPWGEPGPLVNFKGPDLWQELFLKKLGDDVRARAFDGQHTVMPIRRAISSGHGIGKSVMVAWLVHWLMSTRPHAQGVVTANTSTQLETKTWAAIQRWLKLCITSHWFTVNAARLYHTQYRESWFCTPQTCKEENSEAFAGQHAADSSSFYINDEDSAVPDAIHEVEEGGLTDGEPFIFLFGNATRSSGAFYKACFGTMRDRWCPTIVDSRDSAFTNKQQIAEWIADYGEDSDFVRVRVRGLPPAASDLQYIDSETVRLAQQRPLVVFADDPIICGLDVARGGGDECVFRFRRGHDARSIPPVRVPGEQARDSMRLVTLAADILGKTYGERWRVEQLFVDGTGIGGPIVDRLHQLGHRNVTDIQFGAHAPDPKFANMRAWMWGELRAWLKTGAIDTTPALEMDLTGPSYFHDKQDRLVLEAKDAMKKRGVDSPDDGDALALTFAQSIRPKTHAGVQMQPTNTTSGGWLGL